MDKCGAVVVTGAAGFIGSHVCEALLARGEHVIGIDNFDPFYDRSLKERNLADIRASATNAGVTFDFHELDICDTAALTTLFQTARANRGPGGEVGCIHLAAKAGPRLSVSDPVGYARANMLGTSSLLDAARAGDCDRMVMASSSSVYGNSKAVPFAETADVGEPISPYAASKRACELLAYTHWHLTKMPTACLRFFTVCGPRQRPDLGVSIFLDKIKNDQPITMFGDGRMSRDCTYIGDIVTGVLAALDRVEDHGYRVWNLGGNEPITLMEMIQTAERIVGKKAAVQKTPMQPGDVDQTYADLSRSSEELNFEPTTSFEQAVLEQWEWLEAQG